MVFDIVKCYLTFTIIVQLGIPSVTLWLDNSVTPSCDGEISLDTTTSLESPAFPDLYPPGLDCRWTVVAPVGWKINVTAVYFNLEDQKECLWDYLEIKDKNTEGIITEKRYCGNQPFFYQSTSNLLNLRFHTDELGSGAGFKLQLTPSGYSKSCNETLTGPSGTFTSPNYPLNYYPDTKCTYLIEGSPGEQIEVSFLSFHVETFPCNFDKLTIFDGCDENAPVLKVACGHVIPDPIVSSSNSMLLVFSSDTSKQTKGFNASYHMLTLTVPSSPSSPPSPSSAEKVFSNCDIILTNKTGNISSPGFPGNYGNNRRCITTIEAEKVSIITIEIIVFDLESSDNCSYDSLTIVPEISVNGNVTSSNLSSDLVLCGRIPPLTLYTFETDVLQTIFVSDKSIDKSGYLAKYQITELLDDTCTLQCDNGGVCKKQNTTLPSWICDCPEGFGGSMCEYDYRGTCYTNKCQNGGGCIMRQGQMECRCLDGFSGPSCEVVLNETEVHNKPHIFSKFPRNLTLSAGSSVLMECAVIDPTADVMWLHKDRVLSEGDDGTGIEVHPGGVLHIPEMTDEQEGKYTCLAVFAKELHEVSAWIKLIEPCHLHVVIAPQNVTVDEGSSALFQCFVPDAKFVVWKKDGELLHLDKRKRVLVNNYLRIEQIIETDSGEYTCSARNHNGCSAKISAFMHVQIKGHHYACGKAQIIENTVNLRISSGRESPLGAAPWHVIIREKELGVTYCGGSLITDRWVMTAAHCVYRFKDIFKMDFQKEYVDLYVGTRHCRGDGGIRRSVRSYKLHPGFNSSYHNNDLALFELDEPLVFNDVIMPICLEKLQFVEELLKSGRLGMVTGCGQLHEGGRSPLYLNEVRIPYVNRKECRRRVDAIPDAQFTDNMICAGYQRHMRGDACAGDSGGAFVMEYNGRWIQVGIVSWGVGCDRQNQYGYYTHVSKFYDWIENTVF